MNRAFPRRCDRIEAIDRPDCDPATMRRTLRQFERINILFSGSRRLIRRHVFPLLAAEPARDHTFLDVGAGGGDIARWLARVARRRGWPLRIAALEPDARIRPWLEEWVRDDPEIAVRAGRVQDLAAGGQRFDVVFSNHVLHHLTDAETPGFVAACAALAGRVLLLNDLRRSVWAWLGFALFGALFPHRSYAIGDGLLSIRRAFRPAELAALLGPDLARAGVRVVTAAPARLVVVAPVRAPPDPAMALDRIPLPMP